jgi:hypothetical protein
MEVLPTNGWMDKDGKRLDMGTARHTFRVAVTVQPTDEKGKPSDLRVMSLICSFPVSPSPIANYRFDKSLETQFMITMVTMVTMMITFLVPN